MARDFISIDTAKPYGNELKRCLNNLQDSLDALRRLNDTALHNIDTGAAVGQKYLDWKNLVGTTQVLTETNGDESGQTCYNLLAGAVAAVDSVAVNNFIEQIG